MSTHDGRSNASGGRTPATPRSTATATAGRKPDTPPAARTSATPSSLADPALAAPPPLRRRPVYLIAGLLALAFGAVMSAWLYTRMGNTQPVLAVRQDVLRGEVITSADLVTVDIAVDQALRVVGADQRGTVVGRRATIDLPAGGLVVADSFATTTLPAPGQSLVGVWLAPGQLPGVDLRPGDRVRAVATPRAQDDAPAKSPATLPAVVAGVETTADGHTLVTVSVPEASAARLSAMAATARIALVVDSAAR